MNPGIHGSLEKYNFQDIRYNNLSNCVVLAKKPRNPSLNSKLATMACIGHYYYVGSYDKKKNEKKLKLYESLKIY